MMSGKYSLAAGQWTDLGVAKHSKSWQRRLIPEYFAHAYTIMKVLSDNWQRHVRISVITEFGECME